MKMVEKEVPVEKMLNTMKHKITAIFREYIEPNADPSFLMQKNTVDLMRFIEIKILKDMKEVNDIR